MVLVGTMLSDFPKLAAFKPIEVEQAESHTVLLLHREMGLVAERPESAIGASNTEPQQTLSLVALARVAPLQDERGTGFAESLTP
jgi:hypothetical protein